MDASVPVSGKVPILMSARIPYLEPITKAMGKKPDINSFHLVVFDQNGMFVEIAEAEFTGEPILPDDNSELSGISDYTRNFKVILTLTDEPRIIHFIANCPVDQIVYGHESSIIGNLNVRNGETAYWSRAELPHIKVEGSAEDNGYGTHYHPCPDIVEHLEKVHLLRNFAQIMVVDATTAANDKFEMLGYSIYNTINIGTVAPYNNNNEEHPFQCFVDWHVHVEDDKGEDAEVTVSGTGKTYTYEQLLGLDYPYEGHALSSAELIRELPKDSNGIIWYPLPDPEDGNNRTIPFFMYERKVSVRTDEEEKWRESPPHVIVWAKYDGKECYYKFDLVYTTSDKEVKYYNILRNFLYHFTITNVTSAGYKTVEEAMAGAPSNNLSGSTTTSRFPEISVGDASLAVSYTDTTLVSSSDILFRYKYEKGNTVCNGSTNVTLVNATDGTVISSCEISTADIDNQNSKWDGYREVRFSIKEPKDVTEEQIVVVRTDDPNLSRNIRFILKKKMNLRVECDPRIYPGVDVGQYVNIKLPPGLTKDMFPLDLLIEVKGLTLTPDVEVEDNHLPVNSGPSIIPDKNQNSFYFTKTVFTYDEYTSLAVDSDNYRIVETHWRTNRVANASEVYVANKYFNTSSASWINVNHDFSGVKVNTTDIPKGLDRDVDIQFTMDTQDSDWNKKPITVNLVGLRNPNPTGDETADKLIITPNVTHSNVTVNSGTRTITVSGLKTSDKEDKVGFNLVRDDYKLASDESGDRLDNAFTNYKFNLDKLDAQANIPVEYTFTLPQHYVDVVDGVNKNMTITVKMDGLISNDDEKLEYVSSTSSIRTYKFTPNKAGTYTFKLRTTNTTASICWISLDAEQYFYAPVRTEINQSMKAFSNLNIAAVRQGTGRSVNITFNVADADENVDKDINVSLVGMKRSTDDATSFTVNTGSSDVTRNNGKITLKNIVTASVDDPLKVTISAKDYMSSSFTLDNRQSWQFTTFTLNPTSVGAAAGQEVTLTFNSDGLYNGLPVTIELDGLVPATSGQSTKAVSQYTHTVSGTGNQVVKLVTAETVTANKTCSVKLMAEGFEDAEKTVSQNTANHVLKASNTNCTSSAVYDVQAVYQMDKLTSGQNQNYKLVFYARADKQIDAGNFSIFFKINGSDTQQQLNDQGPVTTSWKKWEINLNSQNNNQINNAYDMLCFNLGRVYTGNAIYIDNVSLVDVRNGKEYVLNGDFEGDIVLSSEENKYDGVGKAAPVGTWWVKQNTGATQKPDCTLEIVEYVRND